VADERKIADELLDYLVYAPVGALLTLVEDLPALANKGRSRVQGRLMVARSLGQFAVSIGHRRVQSVVKERVRPARPGARPASPADATGEFDSAAEVIRVDEARRGGVARGGSPADGTSSKTAPGPAPKKAPARARSAATPAAQGSDLAPVAPSPAGAVKASVKAASTSAGAGQASTSAGSLAIPGYDSLAASQVVQRLGGLTLAELEAVGAYEAATRGRRTILGRISQLSNPAAGAVGAASDTRI
jgi:hypothetical protein